MKGPKPRPLADRLAAKVDKHEDGCWIFRGTFKGKARPMIYVNELQRPIIAARVSYEIHRGEIPDGLSVLHTCDNGLCVNPDHLFLGTQKDNMEDCANKGRTKGTFQKRFTDEEVANIRLLHSQGVKRKQLASMMGGWSSLT